jgi:hypothetical protein
MYKVISAPAFVKDNSVKFPLSHSAPGSVKWLASFTKKSI